MKCLYSLALALLLAVRAGAQVATVVNNAGQTVVEDITENAAGIPTTRVLGTLGGPTTTPLTTASTTDPLLQTTPTLATTTTTPAQIGPVGQPGTTPATPGGPTPYVYTYVDQAGNTVVTQGVFTPTSPSTVIPVPITTGTILNYSQWLTMVGSHATASAARRMSTPVAAGWYYSVASALAGLAGGIWLIVL